MPYTLSKNNLTVTITLHHNTIREITLSKASQGVEKTENAIDLLDDISAYLDGERVDFSRYRLDIENLTDFQQMVLNEVRKIPYGMTITYGMLAKDLQTSPRAIGGALSKNPAPIVIPCHRVIGKHGLGGFAWGVTIKKHLLHVEGASIDSQPDVPSTRLEY
ncbi:MAG: Methylated-DNA--protein-cysteine methyltransferase [Candidatus Argoarchaeum ethanivorans]|uniref:methylated-DNA--[protein]-cysteine S-methyltransferase n=1 Tax=Candidatus Argoarchaeum ethanivorans TaxID=2608793 RepID=A0A811T9Z6_9EURY|nr:MAG: Methylated-DNA--protein-cysteine methyltransferase [Candidatus Argoarchaeum ethanivorans]CAD6493790.1 MAG: Methylated-DNA--protein-cysteine methyltransferase [Candidatus Argoarchaeum ethanivorans]